jgi:hypothetical protein
MKFAVGCIALVSLGAPAASFVAPSPRLVGRARSIYANNDMVVADSGPLASFQTGVMIFVNGKTRDDTCFVCPAANSNSLEFIMRDNSASKA